MNPGVPDVVKNGQATTQFSNVDTISAQGNDDWRNYIVMLYFLIDRFFVSPEEDAISFYVWTDEAGLM